VRVTKEKTENSQAFLTIEMEPAEVEESLEAAYHRLSRRTQVPGFRKGKAPREVLERYLRKEGLLEDALNHLLPEAYQNAIKEQNIEAIAQPHIEIAQTEPVVFKAVVPLMPTVELGDYHDIKVAPEAAKFAEDDVSNAIEQLRHQQATWEPAERAVAFGDLVVLDVESSIDDKPFINQKGVQYQVLKELALPAPGFAEQLTGMKQGEEKEFRLQFPSDYPRDEVAGKEPRFKVNVIEIKQENLPELDDEFARGVSPDFENLDSLRERVSTNLKLRAEEQARIDFEDRVIEALVDISRVEFPPVLVEVEIDRLISQQARRWQMDEKGLEAYLRSINKTEAELREELRPLATKRVTQSLALGKIAQEEKIEVGDAEVDAEIESMTKDVDEGKREELSSYLNAPQAREAIGQRLMTQKTIQRLVAIAKGEGVE
jgi:trigger factor